MTNGARGARAAAGPPSGPGANSTIGPSSSSHFTNLLDDEYAEAIGQASLRTVTYDYPDDARTDKALVYTDSLHYRDNIFDFPEHFRRAVTQMGVPGDRLGAVATAATASSTPRSAATVPPTRRISSTSSIWDGTKLSATFLVWMGTGSSWATCESS